ncbi:DUF551 domain-containing protein [Phocaeicola faecalis]
MKQTVEEVAREAIHRHYNCNGEYPCEERNYCIYCNGHNTAFDCCECGAEWKAKQSPWISVEERLPYYEDDVLALDSRGEVYFYHRSNDAEVITDDIRWCIYHSAPIIAWMPIPSFDEIIKSSKNVIQRLKNR